MRFVLLITGFGKNKIEVCDYILRIDMFPVNAIANDGSFVGKIFCKSAKSPNFFASFSCMSLVEKSDII